MPSIGGPELLIVFVVIMLFFGTSRLPSLARSMGQASREFKSGVRDGFDDPESRDKPAA